MRKADLPERTLSAVFAAVTEAHPDKLALRSPDASYTFAGLHRTSLSVGSGLRSLGAGHQQPVLLMLDNHLDHVLSLFGVTLIGGVAVEVNPAYKGSILSYVINNSQAETIVVEDAYCERLAAVAETLTTLRTVIVRGGTGNALRHRFRVVSFDELRTGDPTSPAVLRPDDLYAIMYTSGTTGPSKGVMITHAHAYSHFHPSDLGAPEVDDVALVVLPLFHLAAQWSGIYCALTSGSTAVVLDGFHAHTYWQEVAEYGCTITVMLGAMANFLYRQPPTPADALTPLRRVIMTPVIPEVTDFARRFDVEVATGYGLTEGSAPIIARFGAAKPRACGYLRDDFEARIVNENDIEVPPGEVGELVLRPKTAWTTMAGYWGMPEATAAAWRNLWLHTGDMLYQEPDGQFYFVDRKTDSIRRRGENISSFEVEAEINTHPAVLESAVIAVPSENTEDEVKAVVVLKPGQALEPEELLRYLFDRMAYFMVPRYVEFVDAMSKTPTEKIQKQLLRERGITATTWDRDAAGVTVARDSISRQRSGPSVPVVP